MTTRTSYYCVSCTQGNLTMCKECGKIIEPYFNTDRKKWIPVMSHKHTDRNSKGEAEIVRYPCILLKIFHQHRSLIGRRHFLLHAKNFYPNDFKERKMWRM